MSMHLLLWGKCYYWPIFTTHTHTHSLTQTNMQILCMWKLWWLMHYYSCCFTFANKRICKTSHSTTVRRALSIIHSLTHIHTTTKKWKQRIQTNTRKHIILTNKWVKDTRTNLHQLQTQKHLSLTFSATMPLRGVVSVAVGVVSVGVTVVTLNMTYSIHVTRAVASNPFF